MDYIQTYAKDPFGVSLKVHSLKSGAYHIVGEVGATYLTQLADDIGVEEVFACQADISMEKARGFLFFKGTITLKTERTCVRTLQSFQLEEDLEVDDRLCLDLTKAEEMDEVFVDDVLSFAEFLREQIVLLMDPYPVHPDTKSTESGHFDVHDDLKEEDLDEKNPFSVLKHLKS